MKKTFLIFLTFIICIITIVNLSSCGKVEFKVCFIIDGENYITVNTNGKEIIKMPSDPSKEGYIFDGWYWDEHSWKKPFTANSLLDAQLSENMYVYAKWTTVEAVQGTQAKFEGFTQISDTEFEISVSNSTEILSLGNGVIINSKSSWSLTNDIYGINTIPSKIATLEIGDNIYYALVVAENGQTEMYKLNIRRKPIYTVVFDTQVDNVKKYVNIEEGMTVTSFIPYKKGYTFAGWNYDFDSPIIKNENITASWVANEYVIHYDANGGNIIHDETGVVYDLSYTLEIPHRPGYIFLGWYLNDVLIENGIWKRESNITLVAKWSVVDYIIKYELDGGTLIIDNPLLYNFESDKIVLSSPQKNGYSFLGWTGKDVSEPTINLEIPSGSIGNRSYIAHWLANEYTIKLDTNGGREIYEDLIAIYDVNVTLPTPSKLGYKFVGWYIEDVLWTDGIWKNTNDVSLVAKWDAIKYDMFYELDGGECRQKNPEHYTIEDEFTLTNPTKIGYEFLGWTSDKTTIPTKQLTICFGSTGDQKIIANWKPNINTLVFNSNTGEGTMLNVKMETDSTATLPECSFTKKGYVFDGWSTTPDSCAIYNQGDIYTMGTDSTYTLYASWKVIEYNIKYNLQGGTASNVNIYTVNDTIKITNPQKDGYVFLGWTGTDISSCTTNLIIEKDSLGNREFTANWESYLIYAPKEEGYSVTGVTEKYRSLSEISIPSFYMAKPVIHIESLSECAYAKKLVIPKGVRTIEQGALKGFSSLEYLSLPFTGYQLDLSKDSNGHFTTNAYPFGWIFGGDVYDESIPVNQHYYYQSVVSPSINNAVFYIPKNLTDVCITQKVSGYRSFENCHMIKNIIIPKDTDIIDEYTFYGCSSLKNITNFSNNSLSVKSIEGYAFSDCVNLETHIYTRCVGYYSFHNCKKLKQITFLEIPSTAYGTIKEYIGANYWESRVGGYAFYGCDSLSNVYVTDNLEKIAWEKYSGLSSYERISKSILQNSSEFAKYLRNNGDKHITCYAWY